MKFNRIDIEIFKMPAVQLALLDWVWLYNVVFYISGRTNSIITVIANAPESSNTTPENVDDYYFFTEHRRAAKCTYYITIKRGKQIVCDGGVAGAESKPFLPLRRTGSREVRERERDL